jgi:hypothetical protein
VRKWRGVIESASVGATRPESSTATHIEAKERAEPTFKTDGDRRVSLLRCYRNARGHIVLNDQIVTLQGEADSILSKAMSV